MLQKVSQEDLDSLKYYMDEKRFKPILFHIKFSFETPQLGPYHNEGPTMSSHLSLMIKTATSFILNSMCPNRSLGNFPGIYDLIKHEVVVPVGKDAGFLKPSILDYIFLHDISKPYRLSLSLEGDSKHKKEISIMDWQIIKKKGRPYEYKGKKILSISYFHYSKKENGQHGVAGKEYLLQKGVQCSSKVLKIIGMHDYIYSFAPDTGLKAYKAFIERHDLNEEEISFLIAVTYLDFMASLDADGKPMLAPLVRFLELRELHNKEKLEIQGLQS